MPRIHVVTDSCANFVSPQYAQQHNITVVPNRINIGGTVYREGVDLSPEAAIPLIARQPTAPEVNAPTVAEFAEVYSRVAHTADAIISIHASREIFQSWQNARAAAQQLAGNCEIVVIDSQTLCAAQGLLVKVAVRAIEEQMPLDDIVRLVRGAIERLYAVYYVETIHYLRQNNIMSVSHSILGAMLGIKPFITIENGRLVPIEKVKTRGQAIERLVEFAVEFTDIEETALLQHRTNISEQTRMLQDRLGSEFPAQKFPYAIYSPSLAALIGADATGVVILEEDMGEIDDDF